MAARRRGEDIIDFGMGNPDGADAAAHRREAGRHRAPARHAPLFDVARASRACAARSATGTRSATASSSIPETEAIVTIGSKEGIAHLALATLGQGDTVLVPNPSYPIHIYGPVIAGADIRHVPMTPDVDFFAELEQTIQLSYPKPKLLIVNFPSQPDGAVRRAAVLRATGRARARSTASGSCTTSRTRTSCSTAGRRRRSCRCLVRATSPSSSSRCRRATTWRAGAWASWPATASSSPALARIKGYHDYGTFTPIQVAAIAALEGPQDCVAEIAARYQRRRDVLCKGLHEAGWKVDVPKASMYVWARIPEPYREAGSLEFTKKLLARGEGVGVAGHRVRRVRGWARAVCADRK